MSQVDVDQTVSNGQWFQFKKALDRRWKVEMDFFMEVTSASSETGVASPHQRKLLSLVF